ncbi:hypothetical protein [Pseudothermotoga thermarum]|uniref:RNase NYN domain-containing protein n=1 Tax=Pseudothermotoga thermarum DSM 5069 TaxID=688269 RepID=F7YYW0_9THEM|nr:hypothetical protein [Pseudothermotoga thermarum]AEH51154.1 hypothetical protein Theth_1074 [Pseudothermotoga thermarum DSM 5069]
MLNIYDPDYLNRLKKLRTKRQQIVMLLSSLDKISQDELKSLQRLFIGPIKDKEINFLKFRENLIFLLKGKGVLLDKLEVFAKNLNLPILAGLEVLFWLKPSKFPPFAQEMSNFIGETDLIGYVREARRLLKTYGMQDFIELQAALMKDDDDLDQLASKINAITIYNCYRINRYIPIVENLDSLAKEELMNKLKTHEYIISALFRKPKCPIILDGSNIYKLRGMLKDIEFVLEKLAYEDDFYYPFAVVFDRNIVYLAKNEIEEWLKSKHAIFHSPADEIIIKMALENKAVVVSCDRFLEWNVNIKRINPRRFFE